MLHYNYRSGRSIELGRNQDSPFLTAEQIYENGRTGRKTATVGPYNLVKTMKFIRTGDQT